MLLVRKVLFHTEPPERKFQLVVAPVFLQPCAVTAFFILQGPDALVSEDYYREGIALGLEVKTAQPPMQPAQTGRNHSATGGKLNGAP